MAWRGGGGVGGTGDAVASGPTGPADTEQPGGTAGPAVAADRPGPAKTPGASVAIQPPARAAVTTGPAGGTHAAGSTVAAVTD